MEIATIFISDGVVYELRDGEYRSGWLLKKGSVARILCERTKMRNVEIKAFMHRYSIPVGLAVVSRARGRVTRGEAWA